MSYILRLLLTIDQLLTDISLSIKDHRNDAARS